MPIFHFDFYRLERPEEALRIGLDEYLDGGGVCLVEWADKFPDLLPPETRWLRFHHRADGTRAIEEEE
jgi:tRNA threonylcarbamoyladenosine biosynthesis protein TsaE